MIPALIPLAGNFMDPTWLLQHFGTAFFAVAVAMIFIECAIFPVLPGDSLLFAVGMFIAQSQGGIRVFGLDTIGSLLAAIVILFLSAIAGNMVGYWVGQALGPWLFKPRDNVWGRIFSPKHLQDSHNFFEKYGSKALVLGRFVPFVRTFVTMVAGSAQMTYRHFVSWSALGALIWAPLITLMGFFLGNVDAVRNNIELACLLIVVLSLIPMVVEYFIEKKKSATEAA